MSNEQTSESHNPPEADLEAIARAARLAAPIIILANMDMQGRVLSYDHVSGGSVVLRTDKNGKIIE